MEPLSAAAIAAAKEIGKEVAKKSVEELAKKGATEVAKEIGKQSGKEVLHTAVDTLATESDVPALSGAIRAFNGLKGAAQKLSTSGLNESARIGNSTALRENMVKSGAENVAKTQAHHIVPDEAFRKHSLGHKMTERFGTDYIDKAENGMLLPESLDAKTDSRLSSLPVHRGSHPNYTNRVMGQMDRLQNALEQRYGDLNSVPDSVLDKQFTKLQGNLKIAIENDQSLRKGDRLC